MRTSVRRWLHSFQGQLRLYILMLLALPIALALVFAFYWQRNQVLENEERHLSKSLKQEGVVVQNWIRERFDDAHYLAGSNVLREGGSEDVREQFRRFARSHFFVADILAIAPDGRVRVAGRARPGLYLGDRAYFKLGMAGHDALEPGIVGRASGTLLFICSVPLNRPDGTVAGVLALSVEVASLDQWLMVTAPHAGGEVLLTDAAGVVLAPAAFIGESGGPGKARVSPAALKGGRYTDAAGRRQIGANVPVGWADWRLVSHIPVSNVFIDAHWQPWGLLLGSLCAIVLAVPFALRWSRHFARPLLTLTGYAREMQDSKADFTCSLEAADKAPAEVQELYAAFCTMAAQTRAHIEEVERISVQDALTVLYNRRFLFSSGAKLLAAAQRDGRPCACLMVDVDHFKSVNDTYGHAVGDTVLAHLAAILMACARKADLVVRYGGEEFVVLASGSDAAQAVPLGERIRRTLAAKPCPLDDGVLAVTVSIGVAEARERIEHGESVLDDMLARADQALYAAKAAGRDRVMVAPES